MSCLWPIIRATGKWETAQAVNPATFCAAIRINHSSHTMKHKLLYRKLMKQEQGHTRTGETGQNWTSKNKVTVKTDIQTRPKTMAQRKYMRTVCSNLLFLDTLVTIINVYLGTQLQHLYSMSSISKKKPMNGRSS